MAKKKSTRKPMKKVRSVLDRTFTCLFCHHEGGVLVNMEMDIKVAHLECKACGVTFQARIHALSEPIDVYHDWVDACEAANTNKESGDRGVAGGDIAGDAE